RRKVRVVGTVGPSLCFEAKAAVGAIDLARAAVHSWPELVAVVEVKTRLRRPELHHGALRYQEARGEDRDVSGGRREAIIVVETGLDTPSADLAKRAEI